MAAVIGIDLRGCDCKVAFHLDAIQGSGDAFHRRSSRTSQQSFYTFTIENVFHGINFSTFNNIPGNDMSSLPKKERDKDMLFMNPSAPFLVEISTAGMICLKFTSKSHPDKVYFPVAYLLAVLFRRILNTVSDFCALADGTKGIGTVQAVIVVPAHFDEGQQEAIFKGAALAGFLPVGILRDMAAMCKEYRTLYPYLQTKASDEEYNLFIDVHDSSSVVCLASKSMRVLGSERDDEIGGRDLDLALATHLHQEIYASHNLDIFSVPQDRFMLLQKCSQARAKIIFSQEAVLDLSFPAFNLEYQAVVTVDLLLSLSSFFLDAIFSLIRAALEESDLKHNSIRTVVFSGKDLSLYKPQIMEKLPRAICRSLDDFSTARTAMRNTAIIPELAGENSPTSWIGRLSKELTLSWKPWKIGEGENDFEIISTRVKEISISGSGKHTPLSSGTSHRDTAQLSNEYAKSGVSSFVLDATLDTSDVNADIAKSLALCEGLKDEDPKKPDACNNLCALYMKKYTSTKDVLVLNSALVWAVKSLGNVDYRSPDAKPEYISNVATCLHFQYDQTQDLQTLNMAILYQSYIVDPLPLDDNDPVHAGYIVNYGVLLRTRGEHIGDSDDIVKGAKYLQRAIGILSSSTNPADRPHLRAAVINMGNTLNLLYKYTGTVDDLYHTIQCFEIALALLEEKNAERSVALNGMGLAMMLHHQHFGDMDSVNKAATYFQEALEYVSDDHPSKTLYLSSYANSLAALYQNSKDQKIINRAIEIRKTVIRLTKEEDPSKANYIDKLGSLYGERFTLTSDVKDLDEAVKCHESALLLTNDDQLALKSVFLNNLGTTLRQRSAHLKTSEDFTRSISTLEKALDHTSYGASRANVVFNLADAYMEQYKSERTESLRLKCIELCREVVGSLAPLTVRFHAAGLWTEAALHSTNGPETLDATTTMVDLLSQLAWPGLTLSSQINVLRFANHAASNAAAVALHFKDIRRALEWLEQGRTVSWNQLLHMRSPLEDLKAKEPELAEKIIELSRQLDIGEAKVQASQTAPIAQNTIALERDKLFRKARTIPGFEKLMIAKDYLDFFVGTYDGPIVVVNVSRYRCDAMIFSRGRHPVNLPLETFSLDLAEKLKSTMLQNLKDSARLQRHAETGLQDEDLEIKTDSDIRYGRPRKARVTKEVIDANFRYILKELWIHVVEPIANCLGFGVEFDEDLPHIWWCPTGPLTFLPLHAAGIYAANGDRETARISLMDYAVSSYIPSLSALHNIMYKRTERPPFTLLSVVQPNTPGQQPLPATLLELEVIEKCAQKRGLAKDIHVLKGDAATCEAVINGMKEHSWIHLACHGEQDVHEPTKSGLILHDNRLLLQDIVKTSLPNADFAFLSACQTASGDVGHPDEAVHLAAGMLMAGYRSVIASMWSIGDSDASIVAEDVYDHLFKEGKDPDSRMAARALHRAVRRLRGRHAGPHGGTKFLAWLPFIHFGM